MPLLACERCSIVPGFKLDQHLPSTDASALEQHFHALEKSADHLDEQIEHACASSSTASRAISANA
jgi:hypothetical protein